MSTRSNDPTPVQAPPLLTGSLAACVHAALAHWGEQTPYDCVAALSGASFSPVLRTSVQCPAWWAVSGTGQRLEFMGFALGFRVEASPQDGAHDPEGMAEFALMASSALREGAVVLYAVWPSWGIITGEMPHGDLAFLLGTRDAHFPPRAYVLRRTTRMLSRGEAVRESLRFGAAAAAGSTGASSFSAGNAFYDAWLSALNWGRSCPKCSQSSWYCAVATAGRVRSMQLCAAAYLRRANSLLPDVARTGQLDQIARSYDAMARMLAPYARGASGALPKADARTRGCCLAAVRDVGKIHQAVAQSMSDLAVGL